MADIVKIRKNISFVTNTSGEKVAIQFNLKNKIIRGIVTDFLDILDVIDRDQESSRSFDEVHKQILAKRPANIIHKK